MVGGIEPKLKKVFLKVFPSIRNVDFKKNRDSFENWDSLNHLQLVSEIEAVFGINLEMEEIAGIEKLVVVGITVSTTNVLFWVKNELEAESLQYAPHAKTPSATLATV